MQLIDGQPVFSATDLVGFLACEHLTGLELAGAQKLVKRPERADPELDVIQKRGYQHEARYLAGLEAQGRKATIIKTDDTIQDRGEKYRQAAAATEQAIRRGDDVIYQATFFDGRWLGFADFLLRVDVPSSLGSWSYEVADTKLARHTKASALLQICSYVEQLTRIQGKQPELMHVALGGSERTVEQHQVNDYMAYYRLSKRLFEENIARTTPAYPPIGTYPEPVEHCDVCRWDEVCRNRRRADDDLSLVAGIATRQRVALKERQIPTRRGLANLQLPMALPLEDTRPQTLKRVQLQAQIQVRGEDQGKMLYELIEPSRLKDGSLEPDRGLLSLPEPRPGDLFFDIEGDPYAFDDGVEYLFGVLEPGRPGQDGEPTFHAFWARDEAGEVTKEAEKAAFDRLMALFMDRLAKDPAIHIYHYAPYEPTALGRLMGRHGIREEDVDKLLRGNVLIDLYRAVRQGIRASVESYSIKKLEPLYGFKREINLRDAGSSIAAFETWLQLGDESGEDTSEAGRDEATLQEIERYNHDDVVSTLLLRDWLEARRPELEAQIGELISRPVPRDGDAGEGLAEALTHVEEITRRLTADWPAHEQERTVAQRGRWLLAQLLSWHRREDKSFWWRFFYLSEDLTDEERIAEREPIGALTYVGVVGQEKRSLIYRFTYPEQEHAIRVGTAVIDPATGKSPGRVVAVDEAARTIDLGREINSTKPDPTSLVPCDYINPKQLSASLLKVGEWVAEHGIEGHGPYRAARDLLQRQPPRTGRPLGTPLGDDAETASETAIRVIGTLDASYLAIQGPPGSGKTYTGALMILALVQAGRRVGVTANSHKVIGNLLDKVVELAARDNQPIRIGQKGDGEGVVTCPAAKSYSNDGLRAALAAGEIDVAAGTSWVWARPDFADSVDVLFVDEAGQFALANTVAVAPAAASLVLLGDPQQLDQPLQGSHPPGAERSALAHLLNGATTMPANLGLFLDQTWRLHPAVCAYTSEVFYQDRLTSMADLARQDLDGVGRLTGTGTRYLPVEHTGNQNESPEEAELVADLVLALVNGWATWTDLDGVVRPVTLREIVIVAAYNAQVGEIAKRLPAAARVGTVDKFQGQEAPISIYSMASSTQADAPRGMEFLYSLNRLNVATSRARCLSVVVASPELLRVRARTPRQMRLANALCRFVEMAGVGRP